ncbi:helix-turn-helix domain-containing protein [Klebsiella aerogenes]
MGKVDTKDRLSSGDMMQEVIINILYWIDLNIYEPLNVKDVSRRSGYSHWYFQRRFSEIYGISLGQYIRQKKMILAASLLTETNLPVNKIMQRLGYNDYVTFARIFQRQYKISPTKYREILI